MASLTSANTVSVTVVPSLSGFGRRLKAGVKATNVPPVEVRVKADFDKFKRDMVLGVGMAKSLERNMNSATRSAGKLALGLTAVGAAGLAAGGGAQTILALGGALATASGAALLLPGALASVGAAYATLKVGMSGVKSALDGDAEAMAKLAPAARATVTQIRSFKGEWDSLTRSVQGKLFANTAADMKALGEQQLPVLRTGLGNIADGFNGAARGVMGYLASSSGVGNVTRILDGTAGATKNLAAGAGGATGAVAGLAAAGSQWLPRLTEGFDSAANAASNWVNSAAGQERINELISAGLSVLGDLWSLVTNVGSILSSVFGAMSAAGATTLDTLIGITGQFATWLKSAEGASVLSTIFTNLRDTFENLRPAVSTVAGVIGDLVMRVAPSLPSLAAGFSQVVEALRPVADVLIGIAGWVIDRISWLFNTAPGLVAGLAVAFTGLGIALKIYNIAQSASIAGLVLKATWIGVVRGLTIAWTATQWLLNAALSANPLALVVIALAALVGGLIYAWNNSETFRNIVIGAWNAIKAAAIAVFTAVRDFIVNAFNWVRSTVIAVWSSVVAWFTVSLAAFSAFWSGVWQGISNFFSTIWNWIKTTATNVWNGIVSFLSGGFAFFSSLWSRTWDGIFNTFRNVWQWIKDAAWGAWTWINDKIRAGVEGFAGFFRDAWTGIKDGFGRIWAGIQDLAKAPVRFVIDTVLNKGIGGLWNKAADLFGLDKWVDFPLPPGFATGGAVRGPGTATSDSIPARLSNGEHVLTASDVRNMGGHAGVYALRNAASAGLVPGFADGGPVSWQELRNTVLAALPGTRMSSGYRPGHAGEHGKGLAADFTGNLPAIQNWIVSRFPASHEIIGPVERQNIFNGRPHRYDAATVAGHKDHVHWARKEHGKGLLSSIGDGLSSAWGWIVSMVDQVRDAMAGPEAWLRGAMGGWIGDGSTISKLPGAAMEKLLTIAKDWFFGKAEAMDSAGIADGGPTSGDMLGNARVIGNVARALGFGRNGVVVALATALQESGLRNINYGDRDSVGLFQQRPSMGWGSVAQILNPSYAASKFFHALRGVRGWERLPVTVAAQRVQRSAFPNAYAKHVGRANQLATQIGFRLGGVVGGTGSRDDKLVLAQSGERVLTRAQTESFDQLVRMLPTTSAAVRQAHTGHGLDGISGSGSHGKSVTGVHIENNVVRESLDFEMLLNRASFLAGHI